MAEFDPELSVEELYMEYMIPNGATKVPVVMVHGGGLSGKSFQTTPKDTPTAILVRQVLGAIAQFEKASAVAKLAAARKQKREREGRCEGRKPLSETRPEAVALARKLRRKRPKGGQLSLRGISSELALRGFLNERGKPYAAKSIAIMLS